MIRQAHRVWAIVMAMIVFVTGCYPSRPFYFFEDGDLSHYRGVATEIEYPDVESCTLDEVDGAMAPLTLSNSEEHEIWDLHLEEAVQLALANSKVMRTLGAAAQNISLVNAIADDPRILQQPDDVTTVYNPALSETSARFGSYGPEAALSQFDAQFSTGIFWERNDRPVNLSFPGFLSPVLEQDLGTFRAELSKTAATGTTFAVRNNTSYEWNNNPSNLFPSAWDTNIEAEFSHPLLQGGGVEFNRIAGPNASPGVFQGVAIARINTDIALADFEAAVRNLVSDVENAYWRLYFAYRDLDAKIVGRDSALQTWRRVNALAGAGATGGDAGREAQSREQYFEFRAEVEKALSGVYQSENDLRYIMGLAATDGRLIRPADEPTTAKVQFDWQEIHGEALARSVELRRQRWRVKQRELELTASKNFLLPRLDAVGRYRWRGFGDDLIDPNGNSAPFDNAWQNLTDGDYQEWQLGMQLTVPIGFRQQLSGVRNAQLQLARDRAVLQDQELEISRLLSHAVRNLDREHVLSQTNFNRRIAAQKQVDAYQAIFDVGAAGVRGLEILDLLLDAQRELANAESAYFGSLADYNKSITQVHFRKGSLLDHNGVFLAEGPWASKAYYDAFRRARQRDAGLYLDYGFTRPDVFSRGPIPQGLRDDYPDQYHDGPTLAPPETILTPPPDAPGDAPEAVPAEVPVESAPALFEAPAGDAMPGPALGQPSAKEQAEASRGERFQWGDLHLGSSGKTSPIQGKNAGPQVATRHGRPPGATIDEGPTRQITYERPLLRVESPRETVENRTPYQADRPASTWQRSER